MPDAAGAEAGAAQELQRSAEHLLAAVSHWGSVVKLQAMARGWCDRAMLGRLAAPQA